MARFGRSYPITRVIGRRVTRPSFDNSAISSYKTTQASGSPFTWSQVVEDNAYGVIAVFCSPDSNMDPSSATPAVTFGGKALSSLGYVAANNNWSANGWTWVFGVNKISGGTKTAIVTLTEAGTSFTGIAASFTFNDVSAAGPLNTGYGSSTTPSLAAIANPMPHIVWNSIQLSANRSLNNISFNTRRSYNGTNLTFNAGESSLLSGAFTNSSSFTGELPYGLTTLNLY